MNTLIELVNRRSGSISPDFEEIIINCDGKHTHVIVDGRDISRGCSHIIFEHDAGTGRIRLLTDNIKECAPSETESDDDKGEYAGEQ